MATPCKSSSDWIGWNYLSTCTGWKLSRSCQSFIHCLLAHVILYIWNLLYTAIDYLIFQYNTIQWIIVQYITVQYMTSKYSTIKYWQCNVPHSVLHPVTWTGLAQTLTDFFPRSKSIGLVGHVIWVCIHDGIFVYLCNSMK